MRDVLPSWYGEPPANWEVCRVGDVARVVNGYPFDSAAFSQTGTHRLIRIRDLLADDDQVFFDGPAPAAARVGNNDVLVGMDGDFNVGWWDRGEALLNQRLCCVRAGPRLAPRFLYYALPIPLGIINGLTYFTTVKHLSSYQVAAVRLPLPTLPRQRAIANYLDRKTAAIDDVVRRKEQLVAHLDRRYDALVDDLSSSEPTRANTGVRLGWLLREISRPVRLQPNHFYTEVGVRSHGRGLFRKDPVRAELLEDKGVYRIEPGDLVFNIVFAWEGAVAIAGDEDKDLVGSFRFPTYKARQTEVELRYLRYFFRTRYGQRLLDQNSPGAAGRNKTLDRWALMRERLVLPDLSDQRRRADRLDYETQLRTRLVADLERSISLFKEYRQTLVTAAVTGQLDVPAQSEAA